MVKTELLFQVKSFAKTIRVIIGYEKMLKRGNLRNLIISFLFMG